MKAREYPRVYFYRVLFLSFRTKSELLLDLNISDKTSLNLMGNGECPTAEKQVGSENKPSAESKNTLHPFVLEFLLRPGRIEQLRCLIFVAECTVQSLGE